MWTNTKKFHFDSLTKRFFYYTIAYFWLFECGSIYLVVVVCDIFMLNASANQPDGSEMSSCSYREFVSKKKIINVELNFMSHMRVCVRVCVGVLFLLLLLIL